MLIRILIVDDDPVMLDALSTMVGIRLSGMAVDTCDSASAALERIAQTDYDAIVSDVKMPGMDGLQLMERILKIRPTTPTLLVTGHGDHDMGVKALSAGAYAFIAKPIDRDFFLAWLKRAVQVRQLSRMVEQHTVELEQMVQDRTAELERNNRQLHTVAELARESESLYRSLAEAMPHIVTMTGPGGNAEYVNDRWVDYTGVSKEDALKQEWTQALHSEDKAATVDRWTEAVQEGKIFETECRLRRADGEYRWHLSRAVPVRDAHGAVAKWIGTFTDIHDRKHAEEALRDSEERYKRLVKLSPDAIFVDRENRIAFVNEAALRLFGAGRREELLGKSPFELFHPDCHPAVTQRIERLMAGEDALGMSEERIIRLDGTHADVEVVASRFLDRGMPAIQMILRDITERKRSEEALRQSQGQMRLIADALPLLISYVDADQRYRLTNRMYEQWFGRPRETIEGRTVREVLGEEAYAQVRPHVERALRGELQQFESLLPYKDVGARFVDISYVPDAGPGGDIRGVFVMVVDVTQHKRSEAALRESEERLRLALEAAAFGVWDWDVVRDESHWSPRMRDLYGVGPDERINLALVRSRIHPDDRQRVADELRRSMEQRTEYQAEYRVIRPDGTQVSVQSRGRAQYDTTGQPVHVSGVVLDITARRRAEEAIAESEERFRTLADHMSQFAWMADATGWISWYNRRWFDYTGTTLEEMQGWGWQKVHHPDHVDRVVEKWRRAHRTGEPWEDTFPLRGKDGHYRWFLSRALPIRDAGGQIVRWFGTNTDITDLRAAEEAVRRSEATVRLFIEQAPTSIAMLDRDMRYVVTSRLWRETYGRGYADLVGRSHYEVHTDLPDRWKEVHRRCMAGAVEKCDEDRWVTTDGEVHWLHWEVLPWTNTVGEIGGIIILAEDITDRKRAEEALRASREELRLITDTAPVYIAHCDREGRYKFVNRRYAERLGVRPEDCVGKQLHEVLGPQASERLRAHVDAALSGQSVDFEVEVPYDVLGRRFMQCSYVPEFGSDGTVRGLVAVITDITQRREAEEALRESAERLRAALVASETGTFRWNIRTNELEWDIALNRLFGLSSGHTAYSFDQFLALVHPDDRAGVAERSRRCVEDGADFEMVYRVTWPDGSEHWLYDKGKTFVDEDGTPSYMAGACVDITKRKEAEENLQRSLERLELAQEAGQSGTFEWNIQTNAVTWSVAEERLYGLEPGGFQGRYENWRRVVHPDDVGAAEAAVMNAVKDRIPLSTEFRIVRPHGEVRWIYAAGRVLCNEQDMPVRMVGVNIDVTEHKQAEEEIRRLLGEVRQREQDLRDKQDQLVQAAKLVSLGELATGVAHEINNPLNNIGLFVGNALDAMQKERIDIPGATRSLHAALAQMRKAAAIVEHLRTFGRRAAAPFTPVDLHGAIRSAVSLVEQQLRVRNISVVVDLSSDDPHVMGNGIQLEQVFINLLTNARDAVERAPNKTIRIDSAVHGLHVDVRVTDTGAGIPPEIQSRIFDPFFTTKDVGQGTGLGLSISYGIIKDHGGSIHIENEPGKGATFIIRLPLHGRQG